MGINIMIGADLVPNMTNYELFNRGDIESLIGSDLYEKLKCADFKIFNLEVPLSDEESPIEKSGPHLIAPTSTVAGLKAINPNFFTLANNHILDHGEAGLKSTLATLDRAGIAYSGVGENLVEACKPYIQEINGIKIGIYCCAEHEFSIATEVSAGSNPFDPLESLDHIVKLKNKCDYLIVLYHGGKEYYRYPSPNLQKICRKIVAKGADLVVCQHSHCIGCKEELNKSTIVYGQGNFLFDGSESEFWKTSLLINLLLENDADGDISATFSYIPLYKNNECVRIANDMEKKQILDGFIDRSNEIKDPIKVLERYRDFANELIPEYLNAFYGKKNIIFRAINKISRYKFNAWFMNRRYRKEERIKIKNCLNCEAHREVIMEGLSNSFNEK